MAEESSEAPICDLCCDTIWPYEDQVTCNGRPEHRTCHDEDDD